MKNLPAIQIPEGALQIESKISKTEIINLVIESIQTELETELEEVDTKIRQLTEKLKKSIYTSNKSFLEQYRKLAEDNIKFLKLIGKEPRYVHLHYEPHEEMDEEDIEATKNPFRMQIHIEPLYHRFLDNLQNDSLGSLYFKSACHDVTDYRMKLHKSNLNKTQIKFLDQIVEFVKTRTELDIQQDAFIRQKSAAKNAIISSILSSSEDGRAILDSIAALKSQAMKQLKAS